MKENDVIEGGSLGHYEFNSVREKIIRDYDDAINKYSNRPTKTEHGKVSESLIIKWLSESLPQKFGVTSGYIIPDLYVKSYKIYHFDIIIYDRLEAPILWLEPNKSDINSRAIPAKYVFAVYEVKSSIDPTSVKKAMKKLASLNQYGKYLPKNFHTKVVFMELSNKNIDKKGAILKNFISNEEVIGFAGAYIFRNHINIHHSATIYIDDSAEDYGKNKDRDSKKYMYRDYSAKKIKIKDERNYEVEELESGYSMDIMSIDNKIAGVVKAFQEFHELDKKRVNILWSRNEFSILFHEIISRFTKGEFKRYEMQFGLSFDEYRD